MALEKGYCTKCNKQDESRRIFDVSKDSIACYCPHCGKKYSPKVAIHNYEKVISRYLRRGEFFLKNVVNAGRAYSIFGYILELEPTSIEAKYGRILSLAYMSSLRRNRFSECIELINISRDELRNPKNRKDYGAFLSDLNKCINTYIDRAKRMLTLHSYFFDVDCIKLYLKHVRDSISLKRLLASEFADSNLNASSDEVFAEIKKLEEIYHADFVSADGRDHYFANFTKAGEPLITDGQKFMETKLGKYRLSTLEKNNKKLIYIKDRVFLRFGIRAFNIYEKCFTIGGLLFTLGIVALILYFVFLSLSLSFIILIVAITLMVFGTAFIVLRGVLGIALKKPRI